MIDCPKCGPVPEHFPQPEDESHCGCDRGYLTTDSPYLTALQALARCACPCHGPTWLTENDADVPDFSKSELEAF